MKQKQLLVSGGPVLDSEGRVMSDCSWRRRFPTEASIEDRVLLEKDPTLAGSVTVVECRSQTFWISYHPEGRVVAPRIELNVLGRIQPVRIWIAGDGLLIDVTAALYEEDNVLGEIEVALDVIETEEAQSDKELRRIGSSLPWSIGGTDSRSARGEAE